MSRREDLLQNGVLNFAHFDKANRQESRRKVRIYVSEKATFWKGALTLKGLRELIFYPNTYFYEI